MTPALRLRTALAGSALVALTAGVWGQTRPNPNRPDAPAAEPQRYETTSTAIGYALLTRPAFR